MPESEEYFLISKLGFLNLFQTFDQNIFITYKSPFPYPFNCTEPIEIPTIKAGIPAKMLVCTINNIYRSI